MYPRQLQGLRNPCPTAKRCKNHPEPTCRPHARVPTRNQTQGQHHPTTGYSPMGDLSEATLTPPHTPAPTQPRASQPEPSQPRPTAPTLASNPVTSMENTSPHGQTEAMTETITPGPGLVCTPYDAQLDYNVHPLPNDFNYRVRGILGLHLCLNLSEEDKTAWENAPNSAVIIVPLFMSFSLAHMQEVREDVKIILSRAFPDSAQTITTIPAAKKTDIKSDEAPPGEP